MKFPLPMAWPNGHFGFGSGTNRMSARWTSLAQSLDRSRNPNADTHSQVLTADVLLYSLRPTFTNTESLTCP